MPIGIIIFAILGFIAFLLLRRSVKNITYTCSHCKKSFGRNEGYPEMDYPGYTAESICIPCHKMLYDNYGGIGDTIETLMQARKDKNANLPKV
jgi:hypothetical protein